MKIFSSFDTNLKEKKMKQYIKQYGAERVLLLTKSSLYLWIFVTTPLLTTLAIIAGIYRVIYLLSWENIATTIYIGTPISLIILMYVITQNIIKNYIDYTMDFCIITPNLVEKFDQTWILQRDVKALSSEKIKSVNVRKGGLLYSIFNNGELSFMSEGDATMGEIQLDYIFHPEQAKKKIDIILNEETPPNIPAHTH